MLHFVRDVCQEVWNHARHNEELRHGIVDADGRVKKKKAPKPTNAAQPNLDLFAAASGANIAGSPKPFR